MSIESNIGRNSAVSRGAQRGLFDALEARSDATTRLVTVEDMPRYHDGLVALVRQSIQEVPSEMAWFTYRDIQRFFGISKATIARRLQDGLVPGVRIAGDQVQADGNVRRFDRTQLHWLLLAVRFGRCLDANAARQGLKRAGASV
jgi:hypothetical protein